MTGLTHAQRKERRKAIAEYANEHGLSEAAMKFGVCLGTVTKAAAEHGLKGLPAKRAIERERRKNVALLAAEKGVQEAAGEYGLAGGTVRRCLEEFGLKPAVEAIVSPKRRSRSLQILHALLTTDKSSAEIGRELSVTRQAVSIVHQTAKRIGFEFPHRKTA